MNPPPTQHPLEQELDKDIHSHTLLNNILDVLVKAIRQEIKDIQIDKEDVKWSHLQITWSYIQKNPKKLSKKQ